MITSCALLESGGSAMLLGISCGADPLVRGRRPRRPVHGGKRLISWAKSGSRGTRADQGVRPTWLLEALAFDQIEMPVGTAHQHCHPIGLGIAIDHVVLRNFHFEHRLFQGHGFVPVAIVYAKDFLISPLRSREGDLLSLSVFRLRGGGWPAREPIHSGRTVVLVALGQPLV